MNEQRLAEMILQILDKVSDNHLLFAREAAKRGISLNALIAAAITGMIAEQMLESEFEHVERRRPKATR